jgi:hypothetical protein
MRRLGGWTRHLVEDFELHLRLARAGIKVEYLGSVVVYDEKPATWAALINQRRRWIRGHLSLSFSPSTLRGLPLGEVIYLYSPLGIALSLALLCLGYATALAPDILPPYAYLSPVFWLASLLATCAMLFCVTRLRGNRVGVLPLLAYVFLFGFHWVVVLVASVAPASWARTKTVHGEGARTGLAGYLGLDGVRSLGVMLATVGLAFLWLAPLGAAVSTPEARAEILRPIQAPATSSVAVLSVVGNAEAAGTSSIKGSVVGAADGKPIQGATLKVTSGKLAYSATSKANGSFAITVGTVGTYTFTASKPGYLNGTSSVRLASGQSVSVTVLLSKVHGGVIYLVPVPY